MKVTAKKYSLPRLIGKVAVICALSIFCVGCREVTPKVWTNQNHYYIMDFNEEETPHMAPSEINGLFGADKLDSKNIVKFIFWVNFLEPFLAKPVLRIWAFLFAIYLPSSFLLLMFFGRSAGKVDEYREKYGLFSLIKDIYIHLLFISWPMWFFIGIISTTYFTIILFSLFSYAIAGEFLYLRFSFILFVLSSLIIALTALIMVALIYNSFSEGRDYFDGFWKKIFGILSLTLSIIGNIFTISNIIKMFH